MVKTNLRKAFGYVRVSVDEEGGNNASIESQKQAIEAYAARSGFDVIAIFEEPGVSGQKLSRKQFDRMIDLATADDRPVHAVIVYNLNRFARRLLTQVMAEHKLQVAGVDLLSITEEFGGGPNAQMMRNMIAVMNEKYAHDASLFTRRDRRTNAKKGYWNGGVVPFGYEARPVVKDGDKERKKLFIVEDEAQLVRKIYELAHRGLTGQPMGTRAIAQWLKDHGYRMRGREFFHSAIDGILKRPHYRGSYPDRTADDHNRVPEPEDWIWVACPRIIDGEQAEAVATIRARAAPANTPPRVTNGPTLLTGLAKCDLSGCGRGLTIATGKGGRYSYYACSAKTTGAAKRCKCKNIPEEKLDQIVLQELTARLLQPVRLRSLLAHVLEESDEANQRRLKDLQQSRSERTRVETAIGKLLELIETGLMSPRDPVFAKRIGEQRERLSALNGTIESLERQLVSGPKRLTKEMVDRFGAALKAKLTGDDPVLRKAYVRLLVERVGLSNDAITLTGSAAAMEHALIRGDKAVGSAVPSSDREWCPGEDSNLHVLSNAAT